MDLSVSQWNKLYGNIRKSVWEKVNIQWESEVQSRSFLGRGKKSQKGSAVILYVDVMAPPDRARERRYQAVPPSASWCTDLTAKPRRIRGHMGM